MPSEPISRRRVSTRVQLFCSLHLLFCFCFCLDKKQFSIFTILKAKLSQCIIIVSRYSTLYHNMIRKDRESLRNFEIAEYGFKILIYR